MKREPSGIACGTAVHFHGIRTPNFVGRPARPEPVVGEVQGQKLYQYDFTPEQYRALIHLTAALCQVFPKLRCDYPHDANGRVIKAKLADFNLQQYQGVLGHYHIQTNKTDPGPAFQWNLVINGARALLPATAPGDTKGGARLLLPGQP